ncbi:hypothetical protein LTR28_000296 [Elasticomyces elasticus]|nr:hypothetical protein LTR28_000296 [Elasticomyces elasticus]
MDIVASTTEHPKQFDASSLRLRLLLRTRLSVLPFPYDPAFAYGYRTPSVTPAPVTEEEETRVALEDERIRLAREEEDRQRRAREEEERARLARQEEEERRRLAREAEEREKAAREERGSAKNLPPVPHFVGLAQKIGVPLQFGAQVYEICLTKLATLCTNMVSENNLRPVLTETFVGYRSKKRVYECDWKSYSLELMRRDFDFDRLKAYILPPVSASTDAAIAAAAIAPTLNYSLYSYKHSDRSFNQLIIITSLTRL